MVDGIFVLIWDRSGTPPTRIQRQAPPTQAERARNGAGGAAPQCPGALGELESGGWRRETGGRQGEERESDSRPPRRAQGDRNRHTRTDSFPSAYAAHILDGRWRCSKVSWALEQPSSVLPTWTRNRTTPLCIVPAKGRFRTYRPQCSTSPAPAFSCLHLHLLPLRPSLSPLSLNPLHLRFLPSPTRPRTGTAYERRDNGGGAEPRPGAVHGPVVRDRVLPVQVPAQERHQHARHLHARPGRRRREGAERDVDRRPPRPHRGDRLPRRPRQRRGQAQGQVLRAPVPPRLPRRRRLLGAPHRRRLPVRARRPALQELPLDLVQAAAHGRGRVQPAGGEGQGGRV